MSANILVVDDDPDIRQLTRMTLERLGFTVSLAAGGMEALERLKSETPDLVILDLAMPNQSGTDFFRKLSKDPGLSGIPVIVVSGLAGRHLAVRKPFAVFDKPIDPEEFGATVDRALGVAEA